MLNILWYPLEGTSDLSCSYYDLPQKCQHKSLIITFLSFGLYNEYYIIGSKFGSGQVGEVIT